MTLSLRQIQKLVPNTPDPTDLKILQRKSQLLPNQLMYKDQIF